MAEEVLPLRISGGTPISMRGTRKLAELPDSKGANGRAARMPSKGGRMRLFLRFASFLALTVAVFAGTIDSIQSVAASAPVMTPLANGIEVLGPEAAGWVQSLQRTDAGPAFWLTALHWLFKQPAFAVLLVLALIFWIAGYKKKPAAGRFAA
jgi:hypothetical protein